jgi:6-pyruvoyltetrahydropterin/6-carboxytetrahydropterin synthase
LGEPIFIVDTNPTVEHIAKLIFDFAKSQGFPVQTVRVWETPTSYASYSGE